MGSVRDLNTVLDNLGRELRAKQRLKNKRLKQAMLIALLCPVCGSQPGYAESSGKISSVQQPLNQNLQGGEPGSLFLTNFLK